MDEIHHIDDLYTELKKEKIEYVISGRVNKRLRYLSTHCLDKEQQFFLYLGGPFYMFLNWCATKKSDRYSGISKRERKIIRMLERYDITFKQNCTILVEKEM